MNLEQKFQQALGELKSSPSYSAYSALANFSSKHSKELGLKAYRISILRNFTVEPLLPLLEAESALIGHSADIYLSDFDTIPECVFNPESKFNNTPADFIFLLQWLDTLSPILSTKFVSVTKDEVEAEVNRVITFIEKIIETIRMCHKGILIFNNFPLPTYPTLGILDSQSDEYHTGTIIKLNNELIKIARKHTGVYCLDLMSLFARHGSLNGFDEKHWQMSKAPIGRNVLIPLAQEFGRFFRALTGKTKKCLVLDCDNTLWGGIVGEDGLSGIKLGSTYAGQGYLEFQNEILNLYNRGVILALCSKNNEADVLEVLDSHPDMVLKRKHFATWRINWDDKVSNLQRIALELNIGIDSLVFVDDNPFECDFVREKLPQVEVFEFKKEVYSSVKQFKASGSFDSLVFTDEDRKRNQSYKANKERQKLLEVAGSLDEYLESLDIKAKIRRVTIEDIPRVSQLTQKTNQFNLTTRRYSAAEIIRFSEEKNYDVYSLRLSDRVADLGLVGVAILKYDNDKAFIDSFLLSCRALGRGAEVALLKTLIDRTLHRGCKVVFGDYIPSNKNIQVRDFYEKNQFQLDSTIEMIERWKLDLESPQLESMQYPKWIEVETSY